MNHGKRQTLPANASLAKPTHCSTQSEATEGAMRLAQGFLISDHLSALSKQLPNLNGNPLKSRHRQREKTYLSRIHCKLRHSPLQRVGKITRATRDSQELSVGIGARAPSRDHAVLALDHDDASTLSQASGVTLFILICKEQMHITEALDATNQQRVRTPPPQESLG